MFKVFFCISAILVFCADIGARPKKDKVLLPDDYYYSHQNDSSSVQPVINADSLASHLNSFFDFSRNDLRSNLKAARRIVQEIKPDETKRTPVIWVKKGKGCFEALPFDSITKSLIMIKKNREYAAWLKNPPPKKRREKTDYDEKIAPEVLNELAQTTENDVGTMVAAGITQVSETIGDIDIDSLIAEEISSAMQKVNFTEMVNAGTTVDDFSHDSLAEDWLTTYFLPNREQRRKLFFNTVRVFDLEEGNDRSELREEKMLILIKMRNSSWLNLPAEFVDNLQTLTLLSEAENLETLQLYYARYVLQNSPIKNGERFRMEEGAITVAIDEPPTN